MGFKFYILLFLSIALQVMPVKAQGSDDSELNREYKIKAAFLYNFIKFVDWPEEKAGGQNDPIIIGIIGKDPFKDAFEPIANKQTKEKKSLITRFESVEKLSKADQTDQSEIESLRKCHLVFICSSEKDKVSEVIKLVDNHSVLTVGEMSNMLQFGGIINFLVEENKVRFEINLTAAKQNNLKIRSQLLRLAKRVIDEK